MLQRVQLQNQDSFKYSQNSSNQSKQLKRTSQSPVQIAKTYGTLIWTTDSTLKFLEKVFNDLKRNNRHHHNHHTKKSSHARVLKGNYIKIEVLNSKNYRPIYQEFSHWPKLHFNLSFTDSPFDSEASSREMTRKNNRTKTTQQINRVNDNKVNRPLPSAKKSSQDNPENQCGYCEICRDPYDVLKVHLKTQKHIDFVKNDNNFLELDKLIKKTQNVANFLAIKPEDCTFGKRSSIKRGRLMRECELRKEKIETNYDSFDDVKSDDDDIEPPIRKNGVHNKIESEYSPRNTRTRNNSRNTKTSDNEKKAISNTDEKSPRTLQKDLDEEIRRSRRESCRRINYAEPKEDEENTLDSLISQITEENALIKKVTEKTKVRGIRWRAPSPKDRPPTQKPQIYTVKKSSTTTKSSPKSNQSQTANTSAGEERIKMKLKRIRASELSLLSDEADNFMFPKTAVSEPETDEDRQSTSDHAEISQEIISSERDDDKSTIIKTPEKVKEPEPCTTTTNTNSNTKARDTRRKRRNNLDLFLTEQMDYYKFECPESRLRFQEAPTQPTLKSDEYINCNNYSDMLDDKKISSEDRVGGINFAWNTNINGVEVERFRYSFERVPYQEPWYLAFQRQDEGKEKIFEYYGSTAYR